MVLAAGPGSLVPDSLLGLRRDWSPASSPVLKRRSSKASANAAEEQLQDSDAVRRWSSSTTLSAETVSAEGDEEESPPSQPAEHEPGDLVVLGLGVPLEFRSRSAVVTQVAETHCTVCVLDDSKRFGMGECWPGFADLCAESHMLRLGARVVVSGLQSAKTSAFNGCAGTISRHPVQGHPCFIQGKAGRGPQLAVCVRLESSAPGVAERSVLLEPRFLSEYGRALAEAARGLEEAASPMHRRQITDESTTSVAEPEEEVKQEPRAAAPGAQLPRSEAKTLDNEGGQPCVKEAASVSLVSRVRARWNWGILPGLPGFWGLFVLCIIARVFAVSAMTSHSWEGMGGALVLIYVIGFLCQWICLAVGGI
mmetsp:Transcript_39494/g.91703  ORF Transcript_39494/g.91703 Transcript_39494/m.91703 type:complete len:366 (-) Transcript_39494:30-1127(-)